MASSKVMATSTSANSDTARKTSAYSLSISELQSNQSKNLDSMSMEELIKHIYADDPPNENVSNDDSTGGGDGESKSGGRISLSRIGSSSIPKSVGNKTTEEVWKEIANANGSGGDRKIEDAGEREFEGMTLEQFLAKTGALKEEDVTIPTMVGPVRGFVVDSALDGRFEQQQSESSILWLGNGAERKPGGRGKRRAVQEPLDKVALQRQRRLIKNRESAARSRERKQAYTVELESVVTRLEEENSRLRQEQAEQNQTRYKQLMEYLIPVQEKRRPPRVLRRVRSMHW